MRPTWGLGEATGGFLVAQIGGAGLIALWVSVTEADEVSLVALALGQVGLWLGLLGAPLWAARGSGSLRAEFGLTFAARDSAWILAGVACQVVALPILYFLIELATGDLDVGAPARDLAGRFDGFGYLVFALLVGLVAPVIEELFYRGLLLRSAARRWGDRIAVLVSSVWFGASHFQPIQFPALFGFGVLLAVLTLRYQSLGPAIAAHVGFNVVTVIALGLR